MKNKIRHIFTALSLAAMLVAASCTVSYQFNGASINYDKVKTISIANFPIQSAYVYAPLGVRFNEKILDKYTQQTRLQSVDRGGDLQLEGEIVEYSVRNKAVQADGYSSMVTLTIRVNVRFTNNSNPAESFNNQSFSGSADYESTRQLTDVQDELIEEILDDIIDQIFNATVARW